MGARTVTTREFICNHCIQLELFDNDGRAGLAGWALLTVNGKEFALCPEHYTELKAFLNVDGFGPPLGSVDMTEPPPGLVYTEDVPPGIPVPSSSPYTISAAPPSRKGLFR